MEQAAVQPARASGWIISPVVDLTLLVLTPLAIVPLTMLAGRWLAPETIFLFVVAFASIGHHLPGFMRAYGDRELFQRFRWRFLLAPPLVFLLTLAFALNGLHGLELILLFWATWHIMMQTYGFLRIYDLKRGVQDPLAARLDFSLCGAVFLVGIVFSEARVFGIADTLLRVGLPLPSPAWLGAIQTATAAAAVVLLALYAGHSWRASRRVGLSSMKLLLLASTAGLYWVCGSLSTNLLVGVAMFEIFHALQYFAIVWTYNRRLVERVGRRFGPLGFLFQRRWFFLALYLAAIGAFGSLRLFSEYVDQPAWQAVLLAVLTTSTLLHFYYDGFIWKVRERGTRENLGLHAEGAEPRGETGGAAHLAKWGALAAAAAVLLLVESRGDPQYEDDHVRLAALTAWAPRLPELQVRLSQAAFSAGDLPSAEEAARRAVALRPNSVNARSAYGAALLQRGDHEAAAEQFEEAARLAPGNWENHFDLGQSLARAGRIAEAERSFARAARLAPRLAEIPLAAGRMYLAAQRAEEAAEQFRRAARAAPESAEAHFQWGSALVQAGAWQEAEEVLASALKLDPAHAPAQFQMGNVRYSLGRNEQAVEDYRKAIELAPEMAEAYGNLAIVLHELGREQEAESAYRSALVISPESGSAHFNFGLFLWEDRRDDEARKHLSRAAALGHPLPADLRHAAGL